MDTCLWLLNVCLFCPILFYVSGTFKYYTKVFICVVYVTVGSFFVIVLSLWRPGDAENNRYSSICCILFHRLLGITVAVTGQENVLDEPCVLVSNHQSALDIFAVLAIRPPRCVFLAKKEVRFLFLFGVATMLTGHVFIDRGNSKKAIATLNKTAEDMLQKKLKLFVFPEGTRHSDGPMLPFKKGAFHLAIQAQVPVLPVVITGYDTFYSSKHKRFDTGTVTVHFLPKISTKGMSLSDVGPLAEQVRDIIVEKFARCQNSETSD